MGVDGILRLSLTALILCAMGCGSGVKKVATGEIRGVVTVDNVPLQDGTIEFFSSQTAEGSNAQIDENGHYHVRTIPVGSYQVRVFPVVPDPADVAAGKVPADKGSLIPKSAQSFATSKLEFTVNTGNNEYNLVLKK